MMNMFESLGQASGGVGLGVRERATVEVWFACFWDIC